MLHGGKRGDYMNEISVTIDSGTVHAVYDAWNRNTLAVTLRQSLEIWGAARHGRKGSQLGFPDPAKRVRSLPNWSIAGSLLTWMELH